MKTLKEYFDSFDKKILLGRIRKEKVKNDEQQLSS